MGRADDLELKDPNPIAAPATSVSIDLGAAFASVSVYDPLAAQPLISTFSNTETLSISVTDHPLIVQVANFVAAAAAFGGAAVAIFVPPEPVRSLTSMLVACQTQ